MGRGHLRIYLGAAPGVGKTFAMLDEGFRRHERGTDVVVGAVQTHDRPRTQSQLRDLEVVPPRSFDVMDGRVTEMDVEAVLERRPAVVLVDDLAHTNVSGSRHAKRWQDVDELLAAGIDVVSTLNIEHLESVNDIVERITGVKQLETVPDAFVRSADQVELVDMTPEAIRRRLAHGNIYEPEQVDAALANYFRVGNLGALRELALMWVADKVDDSLQDYMDLHGIDHTWETRERVVVAVTGSPSGEHLIRRAARMAQRARGDLLGVHVTTTEGPPESPSALLERHRQLLADLGGEYHEVVGTDVPLALTGFAKSEHATQLVLGATHRSRAAELLRGSVINRVIREAGEIDIHVISPPETGRTPHLRVMRRRTDIPVRRQLAGWLVAVIGIPLATIVLVLLESSLNLTSDALVYVLLVAIVAIVGGRWPSIVAAIGSAVVLNYFFTVPVHTFAIAHRENFLAFVIFVAVGALVSTVVSQTARSSAAVARSRAEAEALARVAGGLVGNEDAVAEMVAHLRSTFDFTGVSVLVPHAGEWVVATSSGEPVPRSPADGETLSLSEGAKLVLDGPPLAADDRRVLQVFAAQLSSALERGRLRQEALDAAAIAEADNLRTAILRAVSHDLRTPLASIKASVTSLLQHDVDWSDEAIEEFLETIDEEADRLNALVGNLLDMSRLESGALDVLVRPVGLEEVVARALASISGSTERVDVHVADNLPTVVADAALLERAVANLTTNALAFSPDGEHVRIEAGEVGRRIDLRVIDRGQGVPRADRDRVFEPFQRLGDSGGTNGSGVGLGLAVARGFVQAMDGRLLLDDTPGGGLTAIIELNKAP